MIVSLVFRDKHNVSISERGLFLLKNTIKVGDNVEETKIEKQSIADIPFIRYRFNDYGTDEIDYIKKLKNIFKYSAHLAEITIGNNSSEAVKTVKLLTESVDKLCRFVYIDMNDEMLTYVSENKTLPTDLEDALYEIADIGVDQICLRDKTSAAGLVQVNKIRKLLADITLGNSRKYENIAICSSPLTFVVDNSACLTAAKAREYMAVYCRDELTQPTPSANHQCMSCCGCIRYIEITEPITPFVSQGSKSKSSKDKPKTDQANKVSKEPKKTSKAKTTSIRSILF